MKRQHFQNKFFFYYTIGATIVFLGLFAVFSKFFYEYQNNSIKETLTKEATNLADVYLDAYVTNEITIEYFFYDYYFLNKHLNTRTFIINNKSEIVLDSNDCFNSVFSSGPNYVTPITKKLEHNIITHALKGTIATASDNLNHIYTEDVISVAVPMKYENKIYGAIVMSSSYPEIKHSIDLILSIIFIALIIILILVFISTYAYSKQTSRIFQEINRTSQEIAGGNFDARINLKYSSELKELANNMNNMAKELGKIEEMRRDFIANISHDFRSPLTSIKGFVQAILDGTIPTENQGKYLHIVQDEADRLTRLTNDILLLSKMESKNITLERASFDIHEIIRKTLLQFEQKIISKQIDIVLLISKKELSVYADLNQIQRVLYNIFDNAIKFVGISGEIIIETSVIKDKVEISIEDNGQGISEENIKYIWDRFHKGDKSRGMDKKSIGLGLSIVREIIKAHEEQINVYSQEGRGTTFVFTLPLSTKNKKSDTD